MHQLMSSSGMDQDGSHLGTDHAYAGNHWVDSYSTMVIPEYAGGFYMHPVTHGLPSEAVGAGHMPPPPVPHQQLPSMPHHHHPNQHHQHPPPPQQQAMHFSSQLHPSPVMQAQKVNWPSLHTNPGQQQQQQQQQHHQHHQHQHQHQHHQQQHQPQQPQHYSAPPVAIPPQSAPSARQTPKQLPSITTSQPRRTLSDEDRRLMCQFQIDNPKSKQTEIGLKFGVERSTVSKVLSNRDKWLRQEDRGSSPVKKIKGKNVDFERTLFNWLKNQQKKGLVISDEDMETKARTFFAATTGSSENPSKIITASWLEKFKKRHSVGPGSLIRRASESAIPDSTRRAAESPASSTCEVPNAAASANGTKVASPASPAERASPLPAPASRKHSEESDTPPTFADFDKAYSHPHSQSTTSLSSAMTDPPSSSFSVGTFSPASQFTFSPNTDSGIFDQTTASSAGSSFQRPRGQTLGKLDLDFTQTQCSEPQTPRFGLSATAPSSAMDSPVQELSAVNFGLDAAVSPRSLQRSRSNGSLRSTGTPLLQSTGASPIMPTSEDARRAADTLMSYIQAAGMGSQDELQTIMRLTEKLGLHQQSLGMRATSTPLGGLSRIPEGDNEITSTPLMVGGSGAQRDATMTG